MLFVMLFCEYPFERVGDAAAQGGNKFAKVLERIQKVDYRFPENIPVSSDCRDLISKILVADVSKRLTIEQIQAHPWYQVDLPPGVTSMNEQCLALRGQSAGLQTEEEIQEVVMAAIGKGGGGAAGGGKYGKGGKEYDEFIDEALEEDFGDDV